MSRPPRLLAEALGADLARSLATAADFRTNDGSRANWPVTETWIGGLRPGGDWFLPPLGGRLLDNRAIGFVSAKRTRNCSPLGRLRLDVGAGLVQKWRGE